MSSSDLASYREAQAQLINDSLADRAGRILALRRQLAALEGQDDTSLYQAQIRASRPIDLSTCPRCAIWDGRRVDLVPVSPPEAGDPDVDYYRCGDRCGFSNLP